MKTAKEILLHQLKLLDIEWQKLAVVYAEKKETNNLKTISETHKKLRRLIEDLEKGAV